MTWGRLALAALVTCAVGGADTSLKLHAIVAAHGVAAMDAPSSFLRPLATLLVGAATLAAAMHLPRLCLPGLLLVVGGVSSNLVSLALWRAVPDPFDVRLAGGVLHFDLADLCVWGGGLLFLTAALWTIWRMPAERFASHLPPEADRAAPRPRPGIRAADGRPLATTPAALCPWKVEPLGLKGQIPSHRRSAVWS